MCWGFSIREPNPAHPRHLSVHGSVGLWVCVSVFVFIPSLPQAVWPWSCAGWGTYPHSGSEVIRWFLFFFFCSSLLSLGFFFCLWLGSGKASKKKCLALWARTFQLNCQDLVFKAFWPHEIPLARPPLSFLSGLQTLLGRWDQNWSVHRSGSCQCYLGFQKMLILEQKQKHKAKIRIGTHNRENSLISSLAL